MAAPFCFSLFRVPRCRIYSITCVWRKEWTSHGRSLRNMSFLKVFCSQVKGVEDSYGKKWIRRPASTRTDGVSRSKRKSKSSTIHHEFLDETVSSGIASNLSKPETSDLQNIHCFDIRQRIADNKDFCKLVSVITFDIETTGLSRDNDRIIEIAFQDLQGGKNSTFQTLVNPECYIPNAHVHGITNHMVCKPDVPRMKELAPILVEYISSRQKPGGCVMLVAHNGRNFDVPFLVNEFNRCSVDIPPNWLFLDTLPLARQLQKSEGAKPNSKANLPALVEMFNIRSSGTAHRAMADVKSLSLVFQQLTFHLKLSMPCLLKESFTVSDLAAVKKRNAR